MGYMALRRADIQMKSFILSTFGLIIATAAFGHSWYPWECCSDNDCAPLPRETVSEVQGGWKLPDGRFVAYKQAKMSPDGDFHLCESKWQDEPRDRTILCFYAPVGGF